MSSMRRIPEVQDMNISDSPRDPTDVNMVEQETERWDLMLESSPTIEEGIPSTVEQQTGVRDDNIREPRMVEEHIPLSNGGPPISREEHITATINTAATSTFVTTVTTVPRVNVIAFYAPSQFHRHRGRSISTWMHLPP